VLFFDNSSFRTHLFKKKKEKKERRIMDSGKERQEAGVIKAGEDCKCKGK
jgi:hypothetical protein